jgi:hypothetical protein
MEKVESFSGSCLCGSVRYEFSAPPGTTRICWCRVCQKFGAGSATVNVLFPSAALRIDGEVRDFVSVAESGNIMHRRFCPMCGVHLFTASEARPHLIFVRAGTLDDRSAVRPAQTIWVCEAPAWASIDPDLPRFDRQPPPVS